MLVHQRVPPHHTRLYPAKKRAKLEDEKNFAQLLSSNLQGSDSGLAQPGGRGTTGGIPTHDGSMVLLY